MLLGVQRGAVYRLLLLPPCHLPAPALLPRRRAFAAHEAKRELRPFRRRLRRRRDCHSAATPVDL